MIIPKSAPRSLEAAAAALRKGELVVLPTDTIYGFSALDTEDGAALIQKAKKRSEQKGLIRLIANPADIKRYSSATLSNDLLALWPGPLTLVVPLAAGGSAAFRCPGDAWLRDVVANVGRPIFSSSVNASGDEPLGRAADIEAKFGDAASLIIEDDGAGETPALPSTIVDATARPYKVLRQGAAAIPAELLNF